MGWVSYESLVGNSLVPEAFRDVAFLPGGKRSPPLSKCTQKVRETFSLASCIAFDSTTIWIAVSGYCGCPSLLLLGGSAGRESPLDTSTSLGSAREPRPPQSNHLNYHTYMAAAKQVIGQRNLAEGSHKPAAHSGLIFRPVKLVPCGAGSKRYKLHGWHGGKAAIGYGFNRWDCLAMPV